MRSRMLNHNRKKAMSGLETAIILIAFIIVASTFAFTILNLGFQTAQKSGQVVQNGLNQASSALELDGSVVAYGNVAQNNATYVTFVVQLSSGSTPIDLATSKFVVSYQSADKYVANAYTNTTSGVVIKQLVGNGNNLIESGEAFQVIVYLNGTSIHDSIGPYDYFNVQLEPSMGTVLTIQRTLPAEIAETMNLS